VIGLSREDELARLLFPFILAERSERVPQYAMRLSVAWPLN
jgi:hypothetical protein